jgi:hypothetical protein
MTAESEESERSSNAAGEGPKGFIVYCTLQWYDSGTFCDKKCTNEEASKTNYEYASLRNSSSTKNSSIVIRIFWLYRMHMHIAYLMRLYS